MNQKSLSAKKEIHKKIFSYLNEKKISKIYKEFENSLNLKNKFAVAVSGGADSLSLAYLAKCFALKNKMDVKYFTMEHLSLDPKEIEQGTDFYVETKITNYGNVKYENLALRTKASFCLTTQKLEHILPKSCNRIIVDNVLIIQNGKILTKLKSSQLKDPATVNKYLGL